MSALSTATEQTMSSIEIASLTEKSHNHVLVDIRTQIYTGLYDHSFDNRVFDYPTIQGLTVVFDDHTKRTKEILLNRYHTDILVSGYDVRYRAAIVKRWHELEASVVSVSQTSTLKEIPSSVPELQILDYLDRRLRMSDTSVIRAVELICKDKGIGTSFLPKYTTEGLTRALGDLLKEHGSSLSAVKANPKLQELGLLEKVSRRSSNGGTKEFWSITEKGLEFGRNETSPQNPRETQPRWYVDKFETLLSMLN